MSTIATMMKKSGAYDDVSAHSLTNVLHAAVQLAQLDEASIRAHANAPSPKQAEAAQWHEVAASALALSRRHLAEQQNSALLRMRAAVLARRDALRQTTEEAPPMPELLAKKVLPVPMLPFAALSSTDITEHLWNRSSTCSTCSGPGSGSSTPKSCGTSTTPSNSPPERPKCAEALVVPGAGSLRDDLEKVRCYEMARCLIVRRIKRLGLNSPQILRGRFSDFGIVTEVFVAHSCEKKTLKAKLEQRLRPAAIGFVVMDTRQGAEEALRGGSALMVGEIEVTVQPFETFGRCDEATEAA